ncbi:MAG: hypothetical protein JXR41_05730 [Bacteroidales bacterium]|nr:hypothetical protein [Bacteroidales bacterium]MBN2762569.1 hypothetical protein [Bacteroidales bacterium]
MKKILILVWIAILPALVFSQDNKPAKTKIKKMTVTKHDYEKGSFKEYPELKVWYDIKGKVIEEIEYDEETFIRHFKYEYDDAGNKVRETEFEANGKVKKVSLYKYDSSNRRTEKLVYDDKNNLKSKRIYQYESW